MSKQRIRIHFVEELPFEADVSLKDETGWWVKDGDSYDVYVYKNLTNECKAAVLVHELTELKFEKFLPHKLAHWIANLFEKFITGAPCGLCW